MTSPSRWKRGKSLVFWVQTAPARPLRCACSPASGRGRQEAGEHAHRSGLAGAVWTQKTNDLPLFHLEGDVIDGQSAGVSLRQTFDFNHSESLAEYSEPAKTRGIWEMPDKGD